MAKTLNLQTALNHHTAGELSAAEPIYRSILAKNSTDVEANSLLGALLLQAGKLDDASIYLQRALLKQPTHYIAHNNLGHVYHDLGKHEEAEAEYRRALEINPSFVQAWNNLGCLLREQKKFAEAAEAFAQLQSIAPDYAPAYYNLGLIARQQREFDRAIECFSHALKIDGNYGDAHKGLALCYFDTERYEDAVRSWRAAAALAPHDPEMLLQLSLALCKAGQYDDAFQMVERAMSLRPGYAEAYAQLASIWQQRGDLERALENYQVAIKYKPNYLEALSNMAHALYGLDRYSEALDTCTQALAIDPQFLPARINRGAVLLRQNKLVEAEEVLRACHAESPEHVDVLVDLGSVYDLQAKKNEALAILNKGARLHPSNAAIHWNRGLLLLSMGQLAEGWDEYDYGTQTKERALAQRYPFPMWRGEDLHDKTIIVYAEQGLGDEILFASCFPDLIKLAKICIIQCEPRLAKLYQRSFPTAMVHGGARDEGTQWLDGLPPIDVQCPIGSLPRYLRRSIDAFLPINNFLRPDAERAQHWRDVLATLGPGLRVGFAWRSGLRTPLRSTGYTELDDWAPIFRVPGLQLINLQYGDCHAELREAEVRHGVRLHHFSELDLFSNIDDSIALISCLDIVISVGTSTYNFAAGVGRETWLLTPPGVSWVNLGVNAIPWYPSLKLCQQKELGNWVSVFEELGTRLSERAKLPADALREHVIEGEVAPEKSKPISLVRSFTLQQAETSGSLAPVDKQIDLEKWKARGAECFQTARYAEAEKYFRFWVQRENDIALPHYNLGNALHMLGKNTEAIKHYEQALRLEPTNLLVTANLGIVLFKQGESERARGYLETVALHMQSDVNALLALAHIYIDQNRLHEAVDCLQKIDAVRPGRGDVHVLLSKSYQYLGELDKASYHASLALCANPKDHAARHNRGLMLLAQGDLERGWDDVESRFFVDSGARLTPYFQRYPRWQGERLDDSKTLLVYAEQGLGDEVLFASCLPELSQRVKRCIVQCDPRLQTLFARSFPQLEIKSAFRSAEPSWLTREIIDLQIPAGSLPRYFRRRLEDFPTSGSFLVVDDKKKRLWQDRLAVLGPHLKVGIVWRSGLRTPLRAPSYTLIGDWAPVLKIPGAQFISLQYDDCASEIHDVEKEVGVRIHQFSDLDLFNDLDSAAALIAVLDLVICVGVSTYNFSGGLGKNTWLLTPPGKGWVNVGTNRIPWYPSVSLFQQTQLGEWASVMQRVAAQLSALVAETEQVTQFAQPDTAAMQPPAPMSNETIRGELSLLRQLIKPGDTLIDVGAGCGEFSLSLADVVGSTGRIIAVESYESSFAQLEKNVAGRANVQLCQVAGEHGILQEFPPEVTTADRCDVLRIGHTVDCVAALRALTAMLHRCKSFIMMENVVETARDEISGMLAGLDYASQFTFLPGTVSPHGAAGLNTSQEFHCVLAFPQPAKSRENPSTKYRELLDYYREMHAGGYTRVIDGQKIDVQPQDTFPGKQLPTYARPIAAMIRNTRSRTLLDYGAGKGHQYEWEITLDGQRYKNIREYWGGVEIIRYEPALPGQDRLPDQPTDGVLCTDVLEHVPEADLPWVVRELFAHANKFVFASVACYLASARLPNGDNAHCTVRREAWWRGLFESISCQYPGVSYLVSLIGETNTSLTAQPPLTWIGNIPLPK